MAKLYFSELSRKAQKRVNKSLRLFNKNHSLSRDYSFEQTEAGLMEFSVLDPITGIASSGGLSYNKRGHITNETAFISYDNGSPDFFYSIDFYGKKGFKKASKAAYKRGDELSEIIAKHGFDKQRVADWIDDLPGANPNDPYSTIVDFGQTYSFAYA